MHLYNKLIRVHNIWHRVTVLTVFRQGFLRVAGWGGGVWKVPAAYNSKTINGNEMKFGGVRSKGSLANVVGVVFFGV